MKTLTVTTQARAYSQEEAKEYIDNFRSKAGEDGYLAGAASFTYKTKKKKGDIISDGYLVKVTKIYNDFWDAEDCE